MGKKTNQYRGDMSTIQSQENKMKLLIIGGAWPHTKENKEAANVVAHQITRELALAKYFEITFPPFCLAIFLSVSK